MPTDGWAQPKNRPQSATKMPAPLRLGYDVQPDEVVVASLPVIFIATFFAFINSRLLAGRLRAGAGGPTTASTPEGGSDV